MRAVISNPCGQQLRDAQFEMPSETSRHQTDAPDRDSARDGGRPGPSVIPAPVHCRAAPAHHVAILLTVQPNLPLLAQLTTIDPPTSAVALGTCELRQMRGAARPVIVPLLR